MIAQKRCCRSSDLCSIALFPLWLILWSSVRTDVEFAREVHVNKAWKCRGSPCSFPEETLEGYQHAIDVGADYIEMDVVSWPLQPHLRWHSARNSAQPGCCHVRLVTVWCVPRTGEHKGRRAAVPP